jgi:hypothetical protein
VAQVSRAQTYKATKRRERNEPPEACSEQDVLAIELMVVINFN